MSSGTLVNNALRFFTFDAFPDLGTTADALPFIESSGKNQMQGMYDLAVETMMSQGIAPLQRMMGAEKAQASWSTGFTMPSPTAAFPEGAPYVSAGYAESGIGIDTGGVNQDGSIGSSDIAVLNGLLSPGRRTAGHVERKLRTNPDARTAFESSVGGNIVSFGEHDEGRLMVERYPGGYHPTAQVSNPMAASGLAYMSNMQNAVASHAVSYGDVDGLMSSDPFLGMTAMGMYNIGGFPLPQGQGQSSDLSPLGNSEPNSSGGIGSWAPQAMPSVMPNTNPNYERAHQTRTQTLLADPTLALEDKITLFLMLVMTEMDKEIEDQAEYLNEIQNPQAVNDPPGTGGVTPGGGTGGKGGSGGGTADPSTETNPSVDVETLKLKRLVDKRSQMFDTLRQIIDKYNDTAKNIIQSIGR